MAILRSARATTAAIALACAMGQHGAYAKPRAVAAPLAPPMPVVAPAVKENKIDATAALNGFSNGLAVFVRNGVLWLVGSGDDQTVQVKISGPSQKDFGRFERIAAPGGTAFKLAIPSGIAPTVTHNATGWQIALVTGPAKPAPVADSNLSDDTGMTALTLAIAGAGKQIPVTDDETGDVLFVIPSAAGTAYGVARHFSEFELLPAIQGAVVHPLADGVVISVEAENISVGMPKGLKLSDPADRPIYAAAPVAKVAPAPVVPHDERILLDWAAWKLPVEKPTVAREDLEHQAALAADKEKAPILLSLARTIFANGRAPEALGYLNLAISVDPDLDVRDDVRVLRGAALALMGRTDQADTELRRQSIAQTRDGLLWRGLEAARAGHWSDANADFQAASERLPAYPDALYRPLALAAIEAALEDKDVTTAKKLVDELRERPGAAAPSRIALQYFDGRIAADGNDKDAATAAWDKVAHSHDQYYRTRAELALVEAGIAAKTIEPKAAVDRLNRLRVAWRGDDFENKVLGTLGDIALQAEDYETAQTAFRDIAAMAGTGPAADDAKKHLATLFRSLFIDGVADKLPPLRALALFNTMSDLAPAGPDGDKALDRLSDRMVQMDLLSQAADIIEGEVTRQGDASLKSQLGARAAALRLLDEKPELAVRVLDASENDAGSADLKGNRRLLRVRALSKQGRFDDALKLLGTDAEPAADALRVDIGWAGQRWRVAADALAHLVGAPPADGHADEVKAALVLRRALALNLLQDAPGLQALRRDFAPSLAGTKAASQFEVLTKPTGEGALANVNIIRSAIAEVDLFKDFLGAYKAPVPDHPGA